MEISYNCTNMKVFYMLALFILFSGSLPALASDGRDYSEYYKAYDICSPAAHFLTRQECNYSNIFQNFYVDCMHQKGYGDDSDITDAGYYEGYMKAYNQCSSVADRSAQKQCGYGTLYYNHYNDCMTKHGFDKYGEKIRPSPPSKPTEPKEEGGFKFNF